MNPFQYYEPILKANLKPYGATKIYALWNDRTRFYHNLSHLKDVLAYIQRYSYRLAEEEFSDLVLAAFYHDAIYDPKRDDNEDKSIALLKSHLLDLARFEKIAGYIELTKHRRKPHFFKDELFWTADNQIFRKNFRAVLLWEKGIKKEFQYVGKEEYKKGRIAFLQTNLGVFGSLGDTNINKLIKHLEK